MDSAEKVQIEETPGGEETKDAPASTTNQTEEDAGVGLREEHAGVETVSKEHVVAEVVMEADQQAQETVTEKEPRPSKEEGEDEREEAGGEKQPEEEVKEKEETARDSERTDEEGPKKKVKENLQEESTTATSDTQDTEPQASLKPDHPKSRHSIRTQESQRSTSSKERRRERKKKKSKGVPKLRRRSSQAEKSTIQYLNAIFFSYFQPLDTTGTGLVPAETFWDVLLSVELNLQLSTEDAEALQSLITPDENGLISYAEFSARSLELICSLYQGKPNPESFWVELRGVDGSVLPFNKQTGEIKDPLETGIDLFEDTICDLFQAADVENQGFITTENFTNMLQNRHMMAYLKQTDIDEILQYFPEGKVTFDQFYPIAKEVILRVYRAKDPSESQWAQLRSPRFGLFWFNKFTGETRRDAGEAAPDEREQEIAVFNEALAQIDTLTLELEQERQKGKELENQLAMANEELEALASQLDDTGRQLDESNGEVANKEAKISHLNTVIAEKDKTIANLHVKVAESSKLQEKVDLAESKLQQMMETIAEKERALAAKEQAVSDVKLETDAVIEQLKNAHGIIDARESSISHLEYDLSSEQDRIKELQKQMPSLESRLRAMVDELKSNQQSLEEKTAIIQQTRRQFKHTKDKNAELEKEVERLSQVGNKLKSAEGEIHTLKSFLTSKTAMVEKRKKEIQELRIKIAELEAKDNRRAIILADVLEKTARNCQLQMATATKTPPSASRPLEETDRPVSAPLIPLLELSVRREEEGATMSHPHTTSLPLTDVRTLRATGMSSNVAMSGAIRRRISPGKRTRMKARSVPRLPPLRQKPDFNFPTELQKRQQYRRQDIAFLSRGPCEAECSCQMCTAAKTASVQPSGLTGQAGLVPLRDEYSKREKELQKKIKIGQRVLVQTKTSMYDLEPQKLTGIVKFVGKIDSEFIDNRIYVGLKLDEPIGNIDGVYKGKRYYVCPPNHGKMVRITSVLAVLPGKSISYQPLQPLPKSSPYGVAADTIYKKQTLRMTS